MKSFNTKLEKQEKSPILVLVVSGTKWPQLWTKHASTAAESGDYQHRVDEN